MADLNVDDFDFSLPDEAIALYPAEPRSSARLLHIAPGTAPLLADRRISDLPDLLDHRDLLVVNNSRVIPANLEARRERESVSGGVSCAKIHLTLHKSVGGSKWRAFARPAKRLKAGDRLVIGNHLRACVHSCQEQGELTLVFEGSSENFMAELQARGAMPLPPYIASKRTIEEADKSRYQTCFARYDGSVAAPTAGLHFDKALIDRLSEAGVRREELTLHVGAGTFRPVLVQDLAAFTMHSEEGEISPEVAHRINEHKATGGRVVAVGTTSLRLLESATDTEGYLHPFRGETDIFITPGYRFRLVDRLLTNFHLPRSTLLMLVAAFSGFSVMKEAYDHALRSGYRFYSFGDACLLEKGHDFISR